MKRFIRKASFLDLLERMQDDDAPPLDDSGIESKAMQVIRVGNNLRSKGDGSFWDDFIRVIGNSEGIAELLGVSSDIVSRWGPKVQEAMQKVERADQNEKGSDDKEQQTIATGGGSEPAQNPGDQPRSQGVPAQF